MSISVTPRIPNNVNHTCKSEYYNVYGMLHFVKYLNNRVKFSINNVILRVLFQDVLSGSSSHARFRLRGVLVIARGSYLSGFGPKTFISYCSFSLLSTRTEICPLFLTLLDSSQLPLLPINPSNQCVNEVDAC